MDKINVITIAGFDPSGGAGILADIKIFSKLGINGMAVLTANTFQTDSIFQGLEWTKRDDIIDQLQLLIENYEVNYFKIGIIENFTILKDVLDCIYDNIENPFIIWDPILVSSTGYVFHDKYDIDKSIFDLIDVITPNWEEAKKIFNTENIDDLIKIQKPSIYIKGGHRTEKRGTDILIANNKIIEIEGRDFQGKSRHGSGCVFSSALLSHIALGYNLESAARKAKKITEKYIMNEE